jgi:glutaredoxin
MNENSQSSGYLYLPMTDSKSMAIQPIHVDGSDKGSIMLYALSTCIHCKQTRNLLDELKVAYDYLYVDQLSRTEMDDVLKEMEKFNPRGSFPTLVINNNKVIIGSRIDEIREVLL